jgi:putative ABC transport system substrate-binding protein
MVGYRNTPPEFTGELYLNGNESEAGLTSNQSIGIPEPAAQTLLSKSPRCSPLRSKRWYHYYALALILVFPNIATAQSSSAQIPRVGYLAWSPCKTPASTNRHFLRGLADLGYKQGETVIIECRSANRRNEGLATAAAELMELRVDVIVSSSEPAARAIYGVTKTIPIVSIFSGDPIAAGMAKSLAQPGGNATGVSYYATELTGKRLDILKKAVPELTSVDVLSNPDVSYFPFEEDSKRGAARLGLSVRVHHVREPADIDKAFTVMKAENAQAVFVLPDLMLGYEGSRIAALALEQRLPTMAWGYWYANQGCLLAYSTWYPDLEYRLAFYVDRILKGAKPGDLPIEQPTKYVLSINLKTAETLGLKLPQTLLLQADNFIE